MPGVLPVVNRIAVENTLLTGLALGCQIASESKFDRKNYAYPDLMKWYQISQYDMPLCGRGSLKISLDDRDKQIGITRVHLEEDTAKMIHGESKVGHKISLIDANRSGVPLMEIVSDPDMTSPEEARAYLTTLRNILLYLDVSTANMQDGAFRCDANISVWPVGIDTGDVKVEIKNMNSFRAVFKALAFEEERQSEVWVKTGQPPEQETRGWVEASGETVSQRSKEYAHDYRYFPEPDLPPLKVTDQLISSLRNAMPELPDSIYKRLIEHCELRSSDALQLIDDRPLLLFFDEAVNEYAQPQRLANWMLNNFVQELRDSETDLASNPVTPQRFVELLQLEDDGHINSKMTAELLRRMVTSGKSAKELVAETGGQITDDDELQKMVAKIIKDNPQAVADFRAGKKQAAGFLVGQVMKATKGRANPGMVNKRIGKELGL
tara:strand:- start:8397 stop:9707 length:1311 start_codon:yes stop_codon:yes gene_type:complete